MNHDIAFFTVKQWASSKIRGSQIAYRLDALCDVPVNQDRMPKHIVCVKCLPMEIDQFIDAGVQVWVDPIDNDGALKEIAKRPGIKVLAIGDSAEHYLHARLVNDVVKIPEHHCNFDREQTRRRQNECVAGYVGYEECFDLSLNDVKEALSKVGISFKWLLLNANTTREEVVGFYKTIDMQVTFRLPKIVTGMPPEMKNPLKVVNAASFGIATVGYPEVSYEEFPPLYSVTNIEDLVIQCKRLKNQQPFYTTNLLERAEAYHIDNIVARYKEVLV